MKEARKLLTPLPDMLEDEQWDAVRTVLKNPPVGLLWNLGEAKNPLRLIAKVIFFWEDDTTVPQLIWEDDTTVPQLRTTPNDGHRLLHIAYRFLMVHNDSARLAAFSDFQHLLTPAS